jgi:hypothetical protein
MKTYSLHPDFFNFFCETCETLDYLESVFPGLVDEKVIANYNSKNNYSSTLRMQVIAAFRDKYSEALITDMRSHKFSCENVFINESDSDIPVIPIREAINANLIVCNSVISFTYNEIESLKYILASGFCNDNVDVQTLDSLKNKINATE